MQRAEELTWVPFEFTLGDRIGLFLKHSPLNQDELASAVGVSPGTISNYINDATEPSAGNLSRIALALGTTPDVLMGVGVPKDPDSPMPGWRNRPRHLAVVPG